MNKKWLIVRYISQKHKQVLTYKLNLLTVENVRDCFPILHYRTCGTGKALNVDVSYKVNFLHFAAKQHTHSKITWLNYGTNFVLNIAENFGYLLGVAHRFPYYDMVLICMQIL